MADCSGLIISDPNRLVSSAADGCAAKVTAAIGGEVKLFFWETKGWEVVLLNRASSSGCDGDCTAFDAMGACHKS